jgi:hypothetical protein
MGAILLAFVAMGIFRAGGRPGIRIEPRVPVIGKRTPVKIELSESPRGLTRVTVELVQSEKSAVLADKGYEYRSQFSFWDPDRQGHPARDAGREVMTGLPEVATIRVTAGRAETNSGIEARGCN